MDPESESESDEEGQGGDEEGGGVAGVTSRIKKRSRDELFQVSIQDIQFKNTQWIVKCGPWCIKDRKASGFCRILNISRTHRERLRDACLYSRVTPAYLQRCTL